MAGFISWQVAFFTGRSKTNGINIHTIIQTTNWVLALLIMVFTYTFNYYYLKIKHSPIILQAEQANSNKSLYSFKMLMFGILICCLFACFVLILQSILPENTLFPFNLYLCIALTLLSLNIARRRNILNYFWHKVRQKTIEFLSSGSRGQGGFNLKQCLTKYKCMLYYYLPKYYLTQNLTPHTNVKPQSICLRGVSCSS